MKKWWLNGACIVMAGALTVFAVGCGDDDKGNNGTGDLTEEEQYAVIAPVMSAAPGLMIQNFGSQFWDGVDPGDFEFTFFGLGKLVPAGLGKVSPDYLAKPVQLEADTVVYGFNSENGWWVFHVEYSLVDDTMGIAVSLTLDDSVRFQTATGGPQVDPNELTETFLNEGTITLDISIDADSLGAFGVELGGENDFTVTGLNDDQVTVNGQTDASINYSFDSDSASAVVDMDFLGTVDDVVAANSPDACPEDGTISFGFSMLFNVQNGNRRAEADGDWSVNVDFTGGGMADVDASSGGFDFNQDDVYVCTPPQL